VESLLVEEKGAVRFYFGNVLLAEELPDAVLVLGRGLTGGVVDAFEAAGERIPIIVSSDADEEDLTLVVGGQSQGAGLVTASDLAAKVAEVLSAAASDGVLPESLLTMQTGGGVEFKGYGLEPHVVTPEEAVRLVAGVDGG
jgi:hypothetical protein